MNRFKEINTINTIVTRAENDIYQATGVRRRLIVVEELPQGTDGNKMRMLELIANSVGLLYADYAVKTRSDTYSHLRMLGAYFIDMYFPETKEIEMTALLGGINRTMVKWYIESAHSKLSANDPVFTPKYDNAIKAVTQWLAENIG